MGGNAVGLKRWREPEIECNRLVSRRQRAPAAQHAGAKPAAKKESRGQWGRAQRAGRDLSARHDILIRGGLLFDGTGAAGNPVDVAIRDGRIAAVGGGIDDAAAKGIDAPGPAVAPGCIDIKTPSHFALPITPQPLRNVPADAT